MDVIRFPGSERPKDWTAPVLALGNFDGLHRGHLEILGHVRRAAAERSATPVVLTFDPHPTHVLRPDKAPPLLMTNAQKLEAFEAAGMRGAAVVRFTAELSQWEPGTFVRAVLVDWLSVAQVWVGANFLFGRGRSGTFDVLRALGEKHGFAAEKVNPVCVGGAAVSSTRVRILVADGQVEEAATLLGRYYFVDGEVVGGDERGRQLGFPTANLRTENDLLPLNGVYATIVRVGQEHLPAVTNLGVRPTFQARGAASIEAHLLGVDRDLYGAHLRLYFVRRLREERAFESAAALARQIEQDCRQAEDLLHGVSV